MSTSKETRTEPEMGEELTRQSWTTPFGFLLSPLAIAFTIKVITWLFSIIHHLLLSL